ncbi:hypothetical protein AALP_AA5G181900 [Arabis alpina]|uniref:Uncharacterized protein n=1 Tax=Arabis alpina TaxID=50452 RepID=A0A087GXW0_ARAAL|nr:hypothetical protein AALP_AA5G181900 [Arabis alpina]
MVKKMKNMVGGDYGNSVEGPQGTMVVVMLGEWIVINGGV